MNLTITITHVIITNTVIRDDVRIHFLVGELVVDAIAVGLVSGARVVEVRACSGGRAAQRVAVICIIIIIIITNYCRRSHVCQTCTIIRLVLVQSCA